MQMYREAAAEMAANEVARAHHIPARSAWAIAEALLEGLSNIEAGPFGIAIGLMGAPLNISAAKAEREAKPMPEDWYMLVVGSAGDDARFMVGNILANGKTFTIGDAIRFMAVEKEAPVRSDPLTELAGTPVQARAELQAYYHAKRSLVDKAVTLSGDVAKATLVGAAGLSVAAFKAARHKLRVGF